MPKEFNFYTLLAITVAIGLAILSPNIPKISSTIGLINGLIILFLLILLIILLDVYLNERRKKITLESRTNKITENIQKIKEEISFLKERFKILEDLSDVRTKIKILEKTISKK